MPSSINPGAEELKAMAETLALSGEYRVQRRLGPRPKISHPEDVELKRALFVDVETTGLDFQNDDIIELAMVPFSYGSDGQIYEVHDAFQSFNKPTRPIPAEITQLTGITDEMVAESRIDPTDIELFARDAILVVAHNAAFDRRFLERLVPTFALKPWACSQSQIDWKAEGVEGTRLAYLATNAGFFYDRHRAQNDCLAAIEILGSPLPRSNVTGLSRLLETARKNAWRIWAEHSPFELKDILKARGYKWNPDGTPSPKGWYIDVPDTMQEAELDFLKREIYQREVQLLRKRIDAFNRFSDRI